MRQIPDDFLLNVAEVSSALVGLFLVGVFFYVETGVRRPERDRDSAGIQTYIRASTRIVLVLFAIPIGLSLTLVAMEPVWPRMLLVVLSVTLVAANVDTARRVRPVTEATGSTILLVTEVLGTIGVVLITLLPWALGGFHPTREDLTWAIVLSFATGLLSVCAIVLSAFDLAALEVSASQSAGAPEQPQEVRRPDEGGE